MKWWNTRLVDWLLSTLTYALAYAIVIGIFAVPITAWKYTQRWVEVPNNLATQGLIFTTTIELEQYKHIGTGSGLFGKYNIYSRSDRHESINVYKD